MRILPRIPVEKLAHEVVGQKNELGLLVDLSAAGLRLEKRSLQRRASPIVQLEFIIPEVEEIAWAQGVVCFDRLLPGMIRSTGIRIVRTTHRHLRLLRDWVASAAEARARADELATGPLQYASHWCG
jgi:hypothetical protein